MRRRHQSSTAAVALLCLAFVWACRSAASVILDLPPAKPAPAAAPGRSGTPGTATRQGSGTIAEGIGLEPAAAPEPPIERVRDRDSLLAMLPKDRTGRIDWVVAVRQGIVKPRPNLPKQAAPQADASGFDFYFKGEDAESDAIFPHSSHGLWMECRSCHPAVYRYRGTRVDMGKIDDGQSCGVCHRTVAFSTAVCYRCHPAFSVRERDKVKQPELGKDVTMSRAGASAATATSAYPVAKFSHWVHRIRYQCSACHPDQFAMKAGATKVTMDAMGTGAACGACHNSQSAFGLDECERCHVAPPPKAP